jgi:ferrous iron transport protein B
MAFFFQAIFSWAQPMMDGIDGWIAALQELVDEQAFDPTVKSLLSKGVIGGVGSVVVFLPQILLLNLLVVLLEESGYLARAAFLVDRAMGLFGLQGRSFIPLLGSFACAIPGIMSARIIPSYRDRLVTIMATPLMTCSARLPVYTLIISALIPAATIGGVFSLQAAVMAGLYVLGAISGLLIALLLKKTMFKGAVVPFLIEFPPYRLPSWKSMWVTVYGRTRDFLTTAGTVILVFSIALWILTELPRTDRSLAAGPIQAERIQIEQSYAAQIGRAIQPAFAPLGFDWRITLGVLSSFAARETFVSSMGQIYAADVQESDESLRTVLRSEYPLAVGLSILAFYVYALQCISTIAIMRRETGSWKWPALAFALTFALAYAASFTAYTLAS